LTALEIETEIRRISEQLTAVNDDTPEMTGMDWASDHGWITHEEWESAEEKSKQGVRLQEAEVEKIEILRREHPAAMDEFLAKHIARLQSARDNLERLAQAAGGTELEFAMRFNLSLLPDIIDCLKQWRGRAKVKHWLPWMWRVAFYIVEESEKFIENARDANE
jgi:hypothetical protein